jgi:type IV pilus biogenesis protein CpaD/CtpE
MPQGFEKVATIVLLAMLSGCAQSQPPKVAILPDASCRLPVVTWSVDDTPETIDAARAAYAARVKLCGKGR